MKLFYYYTFIFFLFGLGCKANILIDRSDTDTSAVDSGSSDDADNDDKTNEKVASGIENSPTLGTEPNLNDTDRGSSLTDSPTITWTAVAGAVSYELAIGTTQGGTDILGFTNVGNVTSYSASVGLTNGAMYYASLKTVDSSGNKSTAFEGDGWQNLKCPGAADPEGQYIKIFGNTTTGLGGTHYDNGTKTLLDWDDVNGSYVPAKTERAISDFCIAKYEMKLSHDDEAGDGVVDDPETDIPGTYDWETDHAIPAEKAKYKPVSVPVAKPWVEIKTGLSGTIGAVQACGNLGANFYLINNSQWQAVARDIETTTSNWYDGGTPGDDTDDYMNRGHSDGAIDPVGDADDTDADPCIGTGNANCETKSHADFTQKRTHDLTKSEGGGDIWDLAGSVLEWVMDSNHRADGHGAAGAAVSGYVSTRTFAGSPAEFKLQWGPKGDHSGKTAGEFGSLGVFFDDSTPGGDTNSANPGPAARGGFYGDGASTGVFRSSLGYLHSATYVTLGFRCVMAP